MNPPRAFKHGLRRSVRAKRSEWTRPLPGDAIIASPLAEFTHAITIRRPPHDVWPWLAQMGAQPRAGWYSYDFLDNGGQPSAARVDPALQSLRVGTIFPALPRVTDGFTVVAFQPYHFLVLGWTSPEGVTTVTWTFALEELGLASTRLIVRVRAAKGYSVCGMPTWLGTPVVRVVHAVMERKQLLGIAERAEAIPPSDAGEQADERANVAA